MIRALTIAVSEALHRAPFSFLRSHPPLELSVALQNHHCNPYNDYSPQCELDYDSDEVNSNSDESLTSGSIWNFAVPKSKVSRSKKRMKTTVQKAIKLKKNIIIDKRTGELTLNHKLPFNWKDYLPDVEK